MVRLELSSSGRTSVLTKAVAVSALLIVLFVVTAAMARLDPSAATNTSAPIRLAILTTPDNGPETFLYIVEVGHSFPPPVARFQHLSDAAVKGVVLADGSVLAVADYEPRRDRSFGSALFHLMPGAKPVLLSEHVVFASKPSLTPNGHVLVSRGSAGPGGQGGQTRVDSLSIDEIDPQGGPITNLWSGKGYIAYIAATFQNDVVVYLIDPSGARLILVDRTTKAQRIILPSMPPFASDFSVTDEGDLFFQNRDMSKANLWTVERLNLKSGEKVLLREDQASMAPRAWPEGEVTWSSSEGLKNLRPLAPVAANSPRGFIDIRAFSADGATAVAYLFPSGSSTPDVVLLDSAGVEKGRIAVPAHTPMTVVGFLP